MVRGWEWRGERGMEEGAGVGGGVGVYVWVCGWRGWRVDVQVWVEVGGWSVYVGLSVGVFLAVAAQVPMRFGGRVRLT